MSSIKNLVRFGYSLDLKTLFPSKLERQNVKLALKIFNHFIAQAWKEFGGKIISLKIQ